MGSDIPVLKTEVPMALPNEPQPGVDQLSTKLYNETHNSVVKITTDKNKPLSGFVAGDDAHIVTSARNLIGTTEQFAQGPDGKRYKLQLEKMDDIKDLAVLRIENGSIPNAKPLALGDLESLNPDDRVWAMGFPEAVVSREPYLSPGYVRGMSAPIVLLRSISPQNMEMLHEKMKDLNDAQKEDATKYLSSMAVESKTHVEVGVGGGPIIQSDGQVIGVTRMTNGADIRSGQTIAAPVEDVKALLEGKGNFEFKYHQSAEPWAEKYLSNWHNDKGAACAETGLGAAIAGGLYMGSKAFPLTASTAVGSYGLFKFAGDLNHLTQSTDTMDGIKWGSSTLADIGTVAGAALAYVPRYRAYGLALAGIGLAGRAAVDFIQNHTVLGETKRLEGGEADKPPFNFDTFLATLPETKAKSAPEKKK
jgi:hypothetical protein